MSIDLSQFHQVFFEESYEGLQIMESGLLELDCDEPDAETINAIFRAAHSIKGSSGTFGFSEVANFTHVMETLLDQVRNSEIRLNQGIVDLLLQSVDCLNTMLSALQHGDEIDQSKSIELTVQFNQYIKSTTESQPSVEPQPRDSIQPLTVWDIQFRSHPDMLKTGNDPIRILRELGELGELENKCHIESIPDFYRLDPETCYLNWSLTLISSESQEKITEVFEWVVDDCQITIVEAAGFFDEQEEDRNQGVVDSQPLAVKSVSQVTQSTKYQTDRSTKNRSNESTSIRVSIDKIDSLVNLVGELVITQSMLSQMGDELDLGRVTKLQEGLAQLEHNTRELQESVMRIRMLPISFTFSRFPRLVRDLSRQLNKKVEIKLSGEQTELDKTVMEKIGDPLVHLIRNALDHGLESPEDRIEAGKPETGTIGLNAYHQGGNIIIEITDDGKGLNGEKIRQKALKSGLISEHDQLSEEQIQELIFQPGFSTADAITDVSGRGVGMDVVRRNIQELNGNIDVHSAQGMGSVFTIRLPLTLAILDGQLIQVGGQTYIIPLVSILESLQPDMSLINYVAGGCDVLRLRQEYIPIIKLYEIFGIKPRSKSLQDSLLVVVEAANAKVALVVDDLLGQQQVVIKSMETNYKKVEGVSGATILGDGTVSLILDITDMIQLAGVMQQKKSRLKLAADQN